MALREGLGDNGKGTTAWVCGFPFFHLLVVAHSMLSLFVVPLTIKIIKIRIITASKNNDSKLL